MRLRSRRPAQSGQGVPGAASLRRTRPAAHPSRPASLSRPAAVLMSADMTTVIKPRTDEQVREAVAWALSSFEPLELVGGGTKRGFGRPVQAAHVLDLSELTGITLYEPEELVLGARAGTLMAEIEAALAAKRQMLAFEPPDLGPLYGGEAGRATLGGVLACHLSGPRRVQAGRARDPFLGLAGVS